MHNAYFQAYGWRAELYMYLNIENTTYSGLELNAIAIDLHYHLLYIIVTYNWGYDGLLGLAVIKMSYYVHLCKSLFFSKIIVI